MSLLLFSSSLNSATPLQKSKFRPPASNSGKNRISYTSCEQKQSKEGIESQVIDRRNVLLGLGGLYGATTTLGLTMPASGKLVGPPDLKKCHPATDVVTGKVECCPFDKDATIIDFVPPSIKERLRVRRAAHKLDDEYIAKFKEGISIMKSLGDDDPLSFKQQAKIHCTFCNGAFDQVRDCLTPQQLRYSYYPEELLPWHTLKPYLKAKKDGIKEQMGKEEVFEFGPNPKELKEAIKAIVTRSKTSRSKTEKRKKWRF